MVSLPLQPSGKRTTNSDTDKTQDVAVTVFAVGELRHRIMMIRGEEMARERIASLAAGCKAGKLRRSEHQDSVRCSNDPCTKNVRLGAIRYGRTMCLACHDDLNAHERKITITAAVPRGLIRGLYVLMRNSKRFWEQSTP